jgi:F420 biosynthesis protein FbiB-like protein
MTSTVETGELAQVVRARRSIRAFRPEPLDPDIVIELLDAAVWAPSPHNSQPWRFTILVDAEDKQRLAGAMASRLALELRAEGVDEAEVSRQTGRSIQRIVSAPAAVLCSLHPDGLVRFEDARRSALEWQMAVQSVGAVLQTLFLLAAERGIGSCWMAAPMYCPDVVRAALDLPGDWEPQALVLLGYSAAEGKVRPRRPLGELVHRVKHPGSGKRAASLGR